MKTCLKAILILIVALSVFGCELDEGNDSITEDDSSDYPTLFEYKCIDLDDSYDVKLWVVDSTGNRIYEKPFFANGFKNEFYLKSTLEIEHDIDIENIDKDMSILCECIYDTYGKLTRFTPLPNDDFQPEWADGRYNVTFLVSPISDVRTKLYFENKKNGASIEEAYNNSKIEAYTIFSDASEFSETEHFVPLINEYLFLIQYNDINNIEVIQNELVNQFLNGRSGNSYLSDLVYAAFIEDRSNLLTNGNFERMNSSTSHTEGWNLYDDASNKSANVDWFMTGSDNTLHIEMTSNRNELDETTPAAFGFYQDQYVSGYNLDNLFISISYPNMIGKLERGNPVTADAAGCASIIIQYIDYNNITIGWTNLVNTTNFLLADTGLVAVPDNIKSNDTTKVVHVPTSNRDMVLNIGRELNYFSSIDKNDIAQIRVWLIVTDYIGHNYAGGLSLAGLLYNTTVKPDCDGCKAEADITAVNLFSLD